MSSWSEGQPWWRRLFRGLLISVALVGLGALGIAALLREVGGASSRSPADLKTGMSKEAAALVERAWQGIEPRRLMDYHAHLVGLGAGGTGCSVNPHMLSWEHPFARLKFLVYVSAAGVTDMARADAQYLGRLTDLARHTPRHGRHLLLAFDHHHNRDGTLNLAKSEFHVPNAYVVATARRRPDLFVPAISVHPLRPGAVKTLEHWADRGVRFVKWLPNAMGIDPSDPRNEPYYAAMKRLGLVLLSHAGEEKAVESEEDQQLGNPQLLRRPLDAGVKVVVDHCASLGKNRDLDDPRGALADNFDLFLRLMETPKYRGLLFGDISAMAQFNRLSRPLATMLKRKDLHGRLVNGSDYPLPAINIIIRTRDLERAGFITATERALLNELYEFNPLLFDFMVKRTVRAPGHGEKFPASVFMVHPELDPGK